MNKKLFVTTSWDDGHKLDSKLASLLKKYDIKGTFYVSPFDHEFKKEDRLTNDQIKEISNDFEIGAHTMTHPHLTKISLDQVDKEIRDSKEYLEKIIDKNIISFCYPYGDFNKKTAKIVKDNGFKIARTVKRYSFEKPTDPFALHTSIHTYNHFSDVYKIVSFAGLDTNKLLKYTDWENLAIDLFEKARKDGDIFHLWGHSWEIDKFNDWDKLERLLKYISRRNNVSYVTNGEINL